MTPSQDPQLARALEIALADGVPVIGQNGLPALEVRMPAFFDAMVLDQEVADIFQFEPPTAADTAGALLDALDDTIDLDARERELDGDDQESAWLTNLDAKWAPPSPAQRRNDAAQRMRMTLMSFDARKVILAVLRHIAAS